MWHDASTICNYGHVLFTCSEVYDKAIHLTDEEVLQIFGKTLDVQETIEQPQIYIFVRCPGSTELTAYSNTRMEDVEELKTPIVFDKAVDVYDIMRFFEGDGPSCQFESGQQKGGNYFCWICGISHDRTTDFAHAAYRNNFSIDDCVKKILKSEVSKRRSKEGFTKLYTNLSKNELIEELDDRGIHWKSSDNASNMLTKLKTEMHGIQKMPSLLFNCPDGDLNLIGLENYEILACEPLHDIENHIKNLFEEIPHQMADKKKVTDFIGAVFNGKDSKRSVDYHTSLIKVCCHFKKEYPDSKFTEILHTLCEIQKVLYQQESHGTNENILYLYIQTFLHMILLTINFEKKIKSMTVRRFFGKYYHAIISHASDQYRIVNGRSSNTESDECYFHTIKDISNNMSNQHPDNIISNAFIRCQVQKDFHENDTILRTEASITKMYTKMSMDLTNSFISFEVIKMYP